jgi:hypothetical protein
METPPWGLKQKNMFKFEKKGIDFAFEPIDYAPVEHKDFRLLNKWSNFVSYCLNADSFWGFVQAKDESEARQRMEKLVHYLAVDIAFIGQSSEFITEQIQRLSEVAEDLKKNRPTEALAVFFGVMDCSYQTKNNNLVKNYKGESIVQMDNGKKYRARAHPVAGDGDYINRKSWIEFTEIWAPQYDWEINKKNK